jgi:two-component system, cell cycle response regulator
VLKEAARRMGACIRSYDTLGRYGGEEFLIVVPSCDSAGALALAERIRRGIESEPVVTDAGNLRITISAGAAVSGQDKPLETQVLLQIADEALYRAKEHGRNRSELARQPEPVPPTPPTAEAALLESERR